MKHLWQPNLDDPDETVCSRCEVKMTKRNEDAECTQEGM